MDWGIPRRRYRAGEQLCSSRKGLWQLRRWCVRKCKALVFQYIDVGRFAGHVYSVDKTFCPEVVVLAHHWTDFQEDISACNAQGTSSQRPPKMSSNGCHIEREAIHRTAMLASFVALIPRCENGTGGNSRGRRKGRGNECRERRRRTYGRRSLRATWGGATVAESADYKVRNVPFALVIR